MQKKEIEKLIKKEIKVQIKLFFQNEMEKIKRELKEEVKSKDSTLKIKEVLVDTTKSPKNPFEILAGK